MDPLEGRKWGSGITDYSGLGPLTYHNHNYVKDLPVGRTHRYYNGGVFQRLNTLFIKEFFIACSYYILSLVVTSFLQKKCRFITWAHCETI